MANIFWKRDKIDRDDAINELMEMLPNYTDTRFKVKSDGDDSGSYICVYTERDENQQETCKDLPQIHGGWRIIHVYTPHEYIKYVLDSRSGER